LWQTFVPLGLVADSRRSRDSIFDVDFKRRRFMAAGGIARISPAESRYWVLAVVGRTGAGVPRGQRRIVVVAGLTLA